MANCSNCLSLSHFQNDCAERAVGGNDQLVFIVPKCEITSYNGTANDIITGITLDIASPGVYKIFALAETVVTNNTLTLPNGFYTQTVTFQIGKFASALSKVEGADNQAQFLQDITNPNDKFVLLIQDANKQWRLFGKERGLMVTALEDTSGTVIGDPATATITFTGGENRVASPVDPSVIASLTIAP